MEPDYYGSKQPNPNRKRETRKALLWALLVFLALVLFAVLSGKPA